MTETVTISRLHVPIVMKAEDVWITYCHACSHEANNYVIECRRKDPPPREWPPFELVPFVPPITPDLVAMARQYDPSADPLALREHLIALIEAAIKRRPRSQQTAIGPSEIGHECGRWLGYKLADVPPINQANSSGWRPQVGTAVHTWLGDDMLKGANAELAVDRFLVEHRVQVSTDPDVFGHGDFYDSVTGTVGDWKVVGPNTLRKVKAVSRETHKPHGPSQRYRVQANIYGRGYAAIGLPVHNVLIAYLPAAGELQDAYFHFESFDAELAAQYVDRMKGTRTLLGAGLPLALVLDSLPTEDDYCTRCPYFARQETTLDIGCPGHVDRKIRSDSLYGLLPPAQYPEQPEHR